MIEVLVAARREEALDICSYELRRVDGQPLPAFTAGAHIDVHLPDGLVRQYSLCNHPEERHRYLIGVLKDPASRGGSRGLHEQVQPGTRLTISEPRNLFPSRAKPAVICCLPAASALHRSCACRTPCPGRCGLPTALLRPVPGSGGLCRASAAIGVCRSGVPALRRSARNGAAGRPGAGDARR